MKRATIVGGAAGIAAALGTAVWALAGGGPMDPSRPGPLKNFPRHGQLMSEAAGTRVTDGYELLYISGDKPARLLEVRSVGGEDALRQLDVLVAGPERKLAAEYFVANYPVTGKRFGELTPLEDAVILPRDQTERELGYELFIGYEILDETKVAARRELVITYEVDGKVYEQRREARLVNCPPDMPDDECETQRVAMFPNS